MSTVGGSSDLVHALSQEERRQRLIDGYIRSILSLKKHIPNDIKTILCEYLQTMDEIKSKTEMKEEDSRRNSIWMSL